MNDITGVPQGSFLEQLLFILHTVDILLFLENHLVGYADDSPMIGIAKCTNNRKAITEFRWRDLVIIDEWCSVFEMRLKPIKTKTMVVSRSETVTHRYPVLR